MSEENVNVGENAESTSSNDTSKKVSEKISLLSIHNKKYVGRSSKLDFGSEQS